MAEEVVVATGVASPEPLDHKRKLADLDSEPIDEAPTENNGEESTAPDSSDVATDDESEAKRLRLDGESEENGIFLFLSSLRIVAF